MKRAEIDRIARRAYAAFRRRRLRMLVKVRAWDELPDEIRNDCRVVVAAAIREAAKVQAGRPS